MYLCGIKQTKSRVNGTGKTKFPRRKQSSPQEMFDIFFSAKRFIASYVSIHKTLLQKKQGGLMLRPFL